MKVSEVSLTDVKRALAIDYEHDDIFLVQVMEAAVGYMKTYTGLSENELDNYPEAVHAFYCLCGDMYDNRSAQVTASVRENPCVKQILGSMAVNYL